MNLFNFHPHLIRGALLEINFKNCHHDKHVIQREMIYNNLDKICLEKPWIEFGKNLENRGNLLAISYLIRLYFLVYPVD